MQTVGERRTMVKYIFVMGGVVSGLGKGITAASLGRLLKARGARVSMQKLDPYLNVDPGTMNPMQHGEVFVTEDGTETDLDLGHYERFIDENLDKNSNVTTGKVYGSVLAREREGYYGGGTVQVIPHITDEIKKRFIRKDDGGKEAGRVETDGVKSYVAEAGGKRAEAKDAWEAGSGENITSPRIHIVEVGGTVGDIESQPYLEAIRQFVLSSAEGTCMLILVSLVPYLKCSGELKSKPTQTAVRTMQQMGLTPDVIVCRSELPLTDGIKSKIAHFCNVPERRVIENLDLSCLYEAPLALEKEKLAREACEILHIPERKPDLREWENMVDAYLHPERTVKIALVGKYTMLQDSYLSVVEALKAGGIACRAKVEISFVDAETILPDGKEKTARQEAMDPLYAAGAESHDAEKTTRQEETDPSQAAGGKDQRFYDGEISAAAEKQLAGFDGIIVPGGFGTRGINGIVEAIRYARERKIPFLGICLGMQLACIEFARHVCGLKEADSAEFDENTPDPIIHLMDDQQGVTDIGGTLRLGSFACVLEKGSLIHSLYGQENITERHRHRYEFNNAYRDILSEHGLKQTGLSPDGRIVEMVELAGHPFFAATQSHPEFKSRPNRPHPLFAGFISAAAGLSS